jgi:hypothetical protein
VELSSSVSFGRVTDFKMGSKALFWLKAPRYVLLIVALGRVVRLSSELNANAKPQLAILITVKSLEDTSEVSSVWPM